MKKLLLTCLFCCTTTLFANVNVNIKFKSDNHRYDNKYKNFNYKTYSYFDKKGYFYNNIYFLYNSQYTYQDRLRRKGNFKSSHAHYRKYTYTKGNDWNKNHNYRNKNYRR